MILMLQGECHVYTHEVAYSNIIFFKSCPHIVPRPGKPGKIYWFSGPPGAGKSTTSQLLARKNGYVYYEADATMALINPFIPVDVDNPSLAQMQQKSLKVKILI